MVNLVILAVMIWTWAQMPQVPAAHVGIRERAAFMAAPTQVPMTGTMYRAPTPPDDYDLIDVKALDGDYWACDPVVPVRGAPGEQFPVLYELHYGDEVRIGERSKGTLGWAMIGRAQWVWEGSLCRR